MSAVRSAAGRRLEIRSTQLCAFVFTGVESDARAAMSGHNSSKLTRSHCQRSPARHRCTSRMPAVRAMRQSGCAEGKDARSRATGTASTVARAARMIGVGMTEDERVEPANAVRAQKGEHDALAGIGLRAIARSGVKQQPVMRGFDQ